VSLSVTLNAAPQGTYDMVVVIQRIPLSHVTRRQFSTQVKEGSSHRRQYEAYAEGLKALSAQLPFMSTLVSLVMFNLLWATHLVMPTINSAMPNSSGASAEQTSAAKSSSTMNTADVTKQSYLGSKN
jgi:hypothetical protein